MDEFEIQERFKVLCERFGHTLGRTMQVVGGPPFARCRVCHATVLNPSPEAS